MLPDAPQPLEYAAPSGSHRFDPATWPSIPAFVVVLTVAAVLSISVGRMIPRGPFISIHADVVPVLVSTAAFHFAWRSLRPSPVGRRIALACILLVSVAIIFFNVSDVVLFWFRPHARGTLIAL
jgi:hypothetical protein